MINKIKFQTIFNIILVIMFIFAIIAINNKDEQMLQTLLFSGLGMMSIMGLIIIFKKT